MSLQSRMDRHPGNEASYRKHALVESLETAIQEGQYHRALDVFRQLENVLEYFRLGAEFSNPRRDYQNDHFRDMAAALARRLDKNREPLKTLARKMGQ